MSLPQGVATAKHTRVVTPKKVTRPSSAKKVAVQKKPSAFHDQFKPTLPTNFKRDSLDRKRQSRECLIRSVGGEITCACSVGGQVWSGSENVNEVSVRHSETGEILDVITTSGPVTAMACIPLSGAKHGHYTAK